MVGFPILIDRLQGIPFSVFIRSDHQIESIYGSYDYLISSNQEVVKKIMQANGELNWHIHIYKKTNNQWIQIRDEEELVNAFIRDYKEVCKIREINHHIVRVGECAMNNSLMKAMNKLGIQVDSTALPGRVRNDEEKFFDWKPTSNDFYNPSVTDYRVPGNFCYKLTEIPISTLYMQASYDVIPLRRYFNLSFKTDVLFQRLDEYIKTHNNLVAITHPFEVLSGGQHGLISFDLNTLTINLAKLKESVLANNKIPVFKKISEFNQD
jgi:soluble P-type ATPase